MSESNGFVTREQLINPVPRVFKVVEIAGFGKVRIRNLTERERSQWEAPNYNRKGGLNFDKLADARCRLVVAAVVDGEGNPLLTNQDVQNLRNQDSRIINELADAISEHCGITKADMEELEKNSEAPAAASQ